MNVFKEIVGSIAGVKAYSSFIKNRAGKVFGYAVLVMTIFFVMANIRGAIGAGIFLSEMDDEIRENVPYFSVQNGQMYIDEAFFLDDSGTLVSFDSDVDVVYSMTESEWRSYLGDYSSVIIADSEGILLKSDGEIEMAEWPEEWSFDRESLIGYLPLITVCVIVYYVFAYIFSVGGYFFAALFVALISMAVTSSQKYHFTFGQIYLLSIYGKTLPLFIKGIVRLLGINGIPFVGTLIWAVGFVIACLYVCYAMAQIDKDNRDQMQNSMNNIPGNMY